MSKEEKNKAIVTDSSCGLIETKLSNSSARQFEFL
jgi:hypothetical protein